MTERARGFIGRNAGLLGAITAVGIAAGGIAAGVAAERYVRRRRGAASVEEDPYADEPFGNLPCDERFGVTAADDVELYVEVVGHGSAARPTLVFVHGFCLDMGTFHFQRQALAQDYRAVLYDQPGHGKSGRLPHGEYTLDALGAALRAVLDKAIPAIPAESSGSAAADSAKPLKTTKPSKSIRSAKSGRSGKSAKIPRTDGPPADESAGRARADNKVVLIGHSMGGMSIMALAEQAPELFRERVAAVILISTSAGRLNQVTFGLPDVVRRFHKPLLPVVRNAGRLTTAMADRARRASSDLAWLLTRRYGFGQEQPSPTLVSYVETMNSTTSTEVIARYVHTLYTHARLPALVTLRTVPVLVICGDSDALTPLAYSQEIVRELPDAELVVVENGGHVALLEHAEVVNAAIRRFLERVG